jgi:hypothetical protein
MEARKEGQLSLSKRISTRPFHLGIIEEVPDITLAEMGECLAGERGVRVLPGRSDCSLTSAASRSRNDGVRLRAATSRCPAASPRLVRRPDRSRSREAHLHQRARGIHEVGATAGANTMRRARPGVRSTRTLEDDHLSRRPNAVRHSRDCVPRWADERPAFMPMPSRSELCSGDIVVDNLPALISGVREAIAPASA